MKHTADPSWIDAYVEHGELPVSRLDQAVLCGELDIAIAMQWCKGTDHLSRIVAMVERRVPSEIRGDVEQVAHWADSNASVIPQDSVVAMLLRPAAAEREVCGDRVEQPADIDPSHRNR
mgnify:CR=1 FL=1